ncbi:MAG: hypothetical protein OEY57_02465 [Nitrospirota bacterium]|nr:hypothetical protein [Nitrospirota bacterium]
MPAPIRQTFAPSRHFRLLAEAVWQSLRGMSLSIGLNMLHDAVTLDLFWLEPMCQGTPYSLSLAHPHTLPLRRMTIPCL